MKTLLIVNPTAGRGNAIRVLPKIREYLTEDGLEFDVILTEAPGHAVELARKAMADGYDLLVAVAGDGTSNEVLNGMMSAWDGQPVGAMSIIPVGSGNDFSVGIGMPQDLREACHRVANGNRRLIDVGEVKDRYFGNGVGVGFDAIVGVVAAKHRFLTGLPLYLLAVFQTILFYFQAPSITIDCDGRKRTAPLIMTSVTNGRRMGGGFWVTPDAEVDDGLLDVMQVREMSRLKMVGIVPLFIKGTHIHREEVTVDRARRVVLTTEGDLVAHVDGELICEHEKRLEIQLHPKALWVVT
ncbi:MAG: diacylglycerol kinase family lipid kinase [Anaerolineae bacterium]|nr:diacylglycerol kinase family lipid kinase [Anaerolineae bacterium]